MYTFSSSREGLSVMACPAAPPADRRLDPSLRKLSVAHFTVANRTPFEPFAQALQAVEDEHVEYGRLQFLHTLNQIRDTLDEHRFQTTLRHATVQHEPLQKTVTIMIRSVVDDLKDIAQRCDRSPRNQDRLTQWPQAIDVLAQAVVTVQGLHDTELDQDWTATLETARTALHDAVATCTTFRNGVGATYAHVPDILPGRTVPQWLDQAREALASQITATMDLSYTTLMRLINLAGNQDLLWGLVQNKALREKAIESHAYRELSHGETQELREGMVRVMRSFDAYRVSGFASALRAIAQEQAYCGASSLTYIESHQDAADLRESHRRDLASVYKREKDKPTAQDLQDRLDKLPADRTQKNLDATARLAYAARIEDAIRHLAQGLALPVAMGSVMTLTAQENGITVGRLNDDPTRVLLAYPDTTVQREGAIYALVAPVDTIAHGVPAFSASFKDGSIRNGWTGTNFPSVGTFMREMESPACQTLMLGKPFAVVHSNPGRPVKAVHPGPHRGHFG